MSCDDLQPKDAEYDFDANFASCVEDKRQTGAITTGLQEKCSYSQYPTKSCINVRNRVSRCRHHLVIKTTFVPISMKKSNVDPPQ